MNKADKLFIGIIILCCALFYVPLWWIHKKEAGTSSVVVVSYKSKEILRVDLNKDHTYKVDGTMGAVFVEIKDGSVRVEKENSPQNLCSIQGWVDRGNRPIVCLPNHIVVQIEATDDEQGDDVVIQ